MVFKIPPGGEERTDYQPMVYNFYEAFFYIELQKPILQLLFSTSLKIDIYSNNKWSVFHLLEGIFNKRILRILAVTWDMFFVDFVKLYEL